MLHYLNLNLQNSSVGSLLNPIESVKFDTIIIFCIGLND